MTAVTGLGEWLAKTVTGESAMRHLHALQRAADANSSNRAAGTPGFDASVGYVRSVLAGAGYDVAMLDAPYRAFGVVAEETLVVGRRLTTKLLDFSPGIARAVLPLALPERGTGGETGDYPPRDIQGAAVLIGRADCGYEQQVTAAAAAGARAVLLYMPTPSPRNVYRLHWYGAGRPPIAVASIPEEEARWLAGLAGAHGVQVALDWRGADVAGVSQNIVAEASGGGAGPAVLAGAHLDSVPDGPGINDNGSTVAAVLEAAVAMTAYQAQVPARVRFVFWATEELVNAGSEFYVRNLSAADREAIGIYINAEMIGSANSGRFVGRGDGVVTTPFDRYFAQHGIPYDYIDVGQIGSDHEPFLASGIPVAVLSGGAMGVKSPDEALRYGGESGQMYDPHYHQPHDTVANLDAAAFDVNARALAFAIGACAQEAA